MATEYPSMSEDVRSVCELTSPASEGISWNVKERGNPSSDVDDTFTSICFTVCSGS